MYGTHVQGNGMAELLAANGWTPGDSLQSTLRDALSDEYYVVTDPVVYKRPLDTVVVGPSGLFVLHERDWDGVIIPTRTGPWLQRDESGKDVELGDPSEEVTQSTQALRRFMRDEFPGLKPVIGHLVVITAPDAVVADFADEYTEPRVMTVEHVADAISTSMRADDGALLDPELRETLAVALRDRKLTADQRAEEPFIFRSGGKEVWTLRELVSYMDRQPEDSIYHLRNGTVERWLDEQGAEHLAELAHVVMKQRESDQRMLLETFLIGTGLVERPTLNVVPPSVDMGTIMAGERRTAQLHIGTARGSRGYLFGAAYAPEPWLQVDPNAFENGGLDATVTVDTEPLLIRHDPYRAEIEVDTNASEEPIMVPVTFQVVGMPAAIQRNFLRPLVGIVSGGVLGAALGWLLAGAGAQILREIPSIETLPLSPTMTGAAVVGVLWAVFGLIRGVRQPAAWTLAYALRRWLLRTAVWGGALALVAALGFWLWRQLPGGAEALTSLTYTVVALLGSSLAIVPAVLDELRMARTVQEKGEMPAAPWHLRLRSVANVIVAVLAIVLATGLGVPAWQQAEADGTLDSARGWVATQSERVEETIDGWIDRYYLERYDRRAPAQQATEDSEAPTESEPAP